MASYRDVDAELSTLVDARTTPDTGDEEDDGISAALIRLADDDPDTAIAVCAAKIVESNAACRAVAAELLGYAADAAHRLRQPVAATLAAAADIESDTETLATMIRALARTAEPTCVPLLRKYAVSSGSQVRLSVVLALSELVVGVPDEATSAVLLDLMSDSDDDVREWATFVVGYQMAMDGDRLRKLLYRALSDPSPAVREEAVRGLACRRDPVALPGLFQQLQAIPAPTFAVEACARMHHESLLPSLLDHYYRAGDDDALYAYAMCADNVLRTGTFAASLLGVVSESLGHSGIGASASIASPLYDFGLELHLDGAGNEPIPILRTLESVRFAL
ncbi:MAG: hypothetical protein EPO13_00475 [Actinomycetota bacterium]|nr:MAG: hypothetical protein EPO13_00475 [Actinomycetota bacterium]